ncbi:hypothetical protein ACFYVL_43925 [Streptomyces sp. NPDC004111]|uniref:hypothetical protein n=1 Tax=Streptomyces sp. NPDC004111 TaxID=3364690 RepID=UPI0036C8A856
MPDKDPCEFLRGPAHKYCVRENDPENAPDIPIPGDDNAGGQGLTDGASEHVKDLANWLIERIQGLIAPDKAWAPEKATDAIYGPFLWLGQHLAVTIFVCVVVVCALYAWQGAPRLKQMGHTTGWTLVAVAAMASIPGAVMLVNSAVSKAFTTAFNSDEGTLFVAITADLKSGADAGNPLAILIIVAALCVALAFAGLVFVTRQLGILVFVCLAPIVFASLARGGDTSAVQAWAQRLLGLMFAPFALLLVAPFVAFAKGSLVVDAVLLIAADVLMLRMIVHGVPYFGPRLARAARSMVESRTSNPLVRKAAALGAPDFHEQEDTPRGPRLVTTPGRGMGQDANVLYAAYGARPAPRPGRLTTDSVISQINTDSERTSRLTAARRQARSTQPAPTGAGPNRAPANPNPNPARRPTSPRPAAPSSPPPPTGGSGSGPANP